MHGPTCIFWADLTPFSLQRERGVVRILSISLRRVRLRMLVDALGAWRQAVSAAEHAVLCDLVLKAVAARCRDRLLKAAFQKFVLALNSAAGKSIEAAQVRKTPSWPRSWANFSL